MPLDLDVVQCEGDLNYLISQASNILIEAKCLQLNGDSGLVLHVEKPAQFDALMTAKVNVKLMPERKGLKLAVKVLKDLNKLRIELAERPAAVIGGPVAPLLAAAGPLVPWVAPGGNDGPAQPDAALPHVTAKSVKPDSAESVKQVAGDTFRISMKHFHSLLTVPECVVKLIMMLNEAKYWIFWVAVVSSVLWFVAVLLPVLAHPELLVSWMCSLLRCVPAFFSHVGKSCWRQLVEEAERSYVAMKTAARNSVPGATFYEDSRPDPPRPDTPSETSGVEGFLMCLVTWVVGKAAGFSISPPAAQ